MGSKGSKEDAFPAPEEHPVTTTTRAPIEEQQLFTRPLFLLARCELNGGLFLRFHWTPSIKTFDH